MTENQNSSKRKKNLGKALKTSFTSNANDVDDYLTFEKGLLKLDENKKRGIIPSKRIDWGALYK